MTSAHTATETHFCKFPNCEREVASRVGRYSYCADHQGQGKTRQGGRGATGGAAGQLRDALALAGKVDKARAKAEQATRRALELKAKADDLEDEYREQLRSLTNGSAAA